MSLTWKHLFVVLLLSAFCCGAVSAEITEELNLTYHIGEYYTDIQAVSAISSEGYYLGIAKGESATLMKTDSLGKEIWRKSFPGIEVRSVLTLSDGGALFTATTLDAEGDQETGYTFSGATYLIRVDKDGNTVWQQELSDTGAGDLAVSGNEIIFAGWFWESEVGYIQSFRLDDGTPANNQMRLGSETSSRIPLGMILESDGSIVLTGGTNPKLVGPSNEAWIMKVKNGAVLWDTVVRTGSLDPLYGEGACGYALCKTETGGYMIVGSHPPLKVTFAAGIAWAASVDSSGNLIWVRDVEGCYAPYGIVPFGSEFLIAGMSGHDYPVWLTITSGGATTQLNPINVQGRFNDIALVSSNTAVLTGWSYLTDEPDGLLIVLTDSSISSGGFGDETSVWLFVLGGVLVLAVLGGLVYFFVVRKPVPEKKSEPKKTSGKGGKKR